MPQNIPPTFDRAASAAVVALRSRHRIADALYEKARVGAAALHHVLRVEATIIPEDAKERAKYLARVSRRSRWPIFEEYVAGRLGDCVLENEMNWHRAMQIEAHASCLASTVQGACSPSGVRAAVDGRGPMPICMPPPDALIGPERPVVVLAAWRRLIDALGQYARPVLAAVLHRAEMRELAPPGTPKSRAAKDGRELLVKGLRESTSIYVPPVAENDNEPYSRAAA